MASSTPGRVQSTRTRSAALIVAALCGLGLVLFLLANFVHKPTVETKPNCQSPVNGYRVVFCGRELMAMVNVERDSDLFVTETGVTIDEKNKIFPVYTQLDSEHLTSAGYTDSIVDLLLRFKRRKVLMLGLGGGAVPFLYSKKSPQGSITSVDISSDSIEIVQQFVMSNVPDRAEFVVDDAQRFVMTAPDGSFDAVVCDVYVGPELPEFVLDDEFIQNVHRVLDSTGIYLINIYDPSNRSLSDRMHDALSRVFMNTIDSELSGSNRIIYVAKAPIDNSDDHAHVSKIDHDFSAEHIEL